MTNNKEFEGLGACKHCRTIFKKTFENHEYCANCGNENIFFELREELNKKKKLDEYHGTISAKTYFDDKFKEEMGIPKEVEKIERKKPVASRKRTGTCIVCKGPIYNRRANAKYCGDGKCTNGWKQAYKKQLGLDIDSYKKLERFAQDYGKDVVNVIQDLSERL